MLSYDAAAGRAHYSHFRSNRLWQFYRLLLTSAACSPWVALTHAMRNNTSSCNPTARAYKFSLHPAVLYFLPQRFPWEERVPQIICLENKVFSVWRPCK
jgi:hypothetical protein